MRSRRRLCSTMTTKKHTRREPIVGKWFACTLLFVVCLPTGESLGTCTTVCIQGTKIHEKPTTRTTKCTTSPDKKSLDYLWCDAGCICKMFEHYRLQDPNMLTGTPWSPTAGASMNPPVLPYGVLQQPMTLTRNPYDALCYAMADPTDPKLYDKITEVSGRVFYPFDLFPSTSSSLTFFRVFTLNSPRTIPGFHGESPDNGNNDVQDSVVFGSIQTMSRFLSSFVCILQRRN